MTYVSQIKHQGERAYRKKMIRRLRHFGLEHIKRKAHGIAGKWIEYVDEIKKIDNLVNKATPKPIFQKSKPSFKNFISKIFRRRTP